MASQTVLTQMQSGIAYQIIGVDTQSVEYTDKLYKMGFVEGTPVELASVKIADPIVVHIRGSRIALRKNEANQIRVEEL
jgi:ferrous iron transport protein A